MNLKKFAGTGPTASHPASGAATNLHGATPPSAWVQRWVHLLAPGTRVLDVACGAGRHSHLLAARGMAVWSADRDAAALAAMSAGWPSNATHPATPLQVDLEGQPWPWPHELFGGVVVTNYLWRPLWPHLLAALAPGGVLLYETFAHGNASVGKPSRPDFLLQPGELLRVCQGLHVVASEDGFCTEPDRFVQRIAAVRLPTPTRTADHPTQATPPELAEQPSAPWRWHLSPPAKAATSHAVGQRPESRE